MWRRSGGPDPASPEVGGPWLGGAAHKIRHGRCMDGMSSGVNHVNHVNHVDGSSGPFTGKKRARCCLPMPR